MSAWGARWGGRWGGRWGAVDVVRGGGWAWPTKVDKRRKKERDDAEGRRGLIEEIVSRAMGLEATPLPVPVRAEVLDAIKPYTKERTENVRNALAPKPVSVDLPAILLDETVIAKVLAIYQEMEDEDELLLLT